MISSRNPNASKEERLLRASARTSCAQPAAADPTADSSLPPVQDPALRPRPSLQDVLATPGAAPPGAARRGVQMPAGQHPERKSHHPGEEDDEDEVTRLAREARLSRAAEAGWLRGGASGSWSSGAGEGDVGEKMDKMFDELCDLRGLVLQQAEESAELKRMLREVTRSLNT